MEVLLQKFSQQEVLIKGMISKQTKENKGLFLVMKAIAMHSNVPDAAITEIDNMIKGSEECQILPCNKRLRDGSASQSLAQDVHMTADDSTTMSLSVQHNTPSSTGEPISARS